MVVSVAVLVSALALMYRSALDQVDALLARPSGLSRVRSRGSWWLCLASGWGPTCSRGPTACDTAEVQTPEEAGDFSADSRRVFVDGDVDVLIPSRRCHRDRLAAESSSLQSHGACGHGDIDRAPTAHLRAT